MLSRIFACLVFFFALGKLGMTRTTNEQDHQDEKRVFLGLGTVRVTFLTATGPKKLIQDA